MPTLDIGKVAIVAVIIIGILTLIGALVNATGVVSDPAAGALSWFNDSRPSTADTVGPVAYARVLTDYATGYRYGNGVGAPEGGVLGMSAWGAFAVAMVTALLAFYGVRILIRVLQG